MEKQVYKKWDTLVLSAYWSWLQMQFPKMNVSCFVISLSKSTYLSGSGGVYTAIMPLSMKLQTKGI